MRKRDFSTMIGIIILFVVMVGIEIYPSNIIIAMEGESVSAKFDISLFADQNYFFTSITSKKILWNIFKPGIYATDGIIFKVVTNRAMEITFDGVQDLEPTDGNGNPAIRTWYAFQQAEPGLMPPEEGDDIVESEDKIEELTELYNLNWYSPDELNKATFEVPPQQNEDGNIMFIWNKIEILATHGPGIYEDLDGFTITLTQLE
jgi:hypothetical protein